MPRKEFELSCMYGDVNRFLCAATTEPMTAREIAILADCMVERGWTYAKHLVSQGLMEQIPARPEKIPVRPGPKTQFEYLLTAEGLLKKQELSESEDHWIKQRKLVLKALRKLKDPSDEHQIQKKARRKRKSVLSDLKQLVQEELVTEVQEGSNLYYYINRKGLEYLKAQ